MTLSDRLKLATQGLPRGYKAGLARACGISEPSVGDWFNGHTKKLEGGNLLKAAEYLKVRPKWLAEGVGPMRLDTYPTANAAMEPSPNVTALQSEWPFKTIRPDEWARLTADQKIAAEGMLRGYMGTLPASTAARSVSGKR